MLAGFIGYQAGGLLRTKPAHPRLLAQISIFFILSSMANIVWIFMWHHHQIGYRLSGVREYWIVDHKQENIMVYSFDNHVIDSYRIHEKGDAAQSTAFKGLAADIESLFNELL